MRTPPIPAPAPETLEKLDPPKWHTLHCELVTPLYGGGVESTKVDTAMPIRVTSIRGQLRFWWRLLAKHDWKLGDAKTIREAEFKLWGGMADGDDGKASKVLLRVNCMTQGEIKPWAEYERRRRDPTRYNSLPTPKDWADVAYALFPAQGKEPDNDKAEAPHALAKAGLSWDLQVAFFQADETQQAQVWQTLRWWANFGGIGARTRRGLGAVYAKYIEDDTKLAPLSLAEIEQLSGITLVTRPAVNEREWKKGAYKAWKESIDKLQSFRQVGMGRASHNNRSRWPEPDAIRNTTNQRTDRHRERLTPDNIFPRAAFGLPIIFQFKDGGTRRTDDPVQTSLQPVYKDNVMERMASPLILRPFFNGNGWQPAALLIESNPMQNLGLSLKAPNCVYDVNHGTATEFVRVTPIANQHTNDPLQAFLKYFAS